MVDLDNGSKIIYLGVRETHAGDLSNFPLELHRKMYYGPDPCKNKFFYKENKVFLAIFD